MRASDDVPRESVLFECDHLRPVVWVDGTWRHIGYEGELVGPCGSIGYRLKVAILEPHYIQNAVRKPRKSPGGDQGGTQ